MTRYIFETEDVIEESSDAVTIVRDKKTFKDFYYADRIVYKNDSRWVPPLWEEMKDFFKAKNLFWIHATTRLFVAYSKDKPVGRIAVFIDKKFIETMKENIGFFGFFECINNLDIAYSLLKAAETYLASQSIPTMIGPVNGRVDMGCGILFKGFEEDPYIYDTYTPRYYITLLETYGMKKYKDLVSYKLDATKPIPTSLKAAAKRCGENGISIRRFNRLRANRELKWWIPLMMDVFSNHWGYIQVSQKEVKNRFGVRQIRWIVDPGLFLIAEKNNEPVAFKWVLPDYNQIFKLLDGKLGLKGYLLFLLKKNQLINRAKFNFVGVKKEYRGQGIASYMNYYTLKELKRRGYRYAEIGWIDEENTPERKATEKLGVELSKIYRIYSKPVKP
ncbi:MAG: hypothetical protein DRN12_03025 [Thermoplasmata archaeon]|nr:MAG: hypothetical protein DRN12_03025 [Thermoplasmata archaeon]HEC89943.1 GNAT family N-acetyltransferase [Thermoplasmatales archaeon]